jgi:predicted choloylglycine hydrolase
MNISTFKVDVLQLRGTSFNIGVSLGKILKDLLIVKVMETVTKQEIEMEKMKSLYSAFAPHLLDELLGLSEGLELPFNKCAAMFSGYDMTKVAANFHRYFTMDFSACYSPKTHMLLQDIIP